MKGKAIWSRYMVTNLAKGTRDFLPEVMVRRNYIFDTIKSVFKRFGFQPIETPSMENLSTLLGKYGDEGDKLLFRVLNSGDFMSGVEQNGEPLESLKLASKISEKGLRYDLTVPFARFVTMYRDQIAFPFKRYQIQPVWRADRPQKGRYREFCQCDVDIIGSDSLLNEAELVQIVDEVFNALKIKVTLKINNRKVASLNTLASLTLWSILPWPSTSWTKSASRPSMQNSPKRDWSKLPSTSCNPSSS